MRWETGVASSRAVHLQDRLGITSTDEQPATWVPGRAKPANEWVDRVLYSNATTWAQLTLSDAEAGGVDCFDALDDPRIPLQETVEYVCGWLKHLEPTERSPLSGGSVSRKVGDMGMELQSALLAVVIQNLHEYSSPNFRARVARALAGGGFRIKELVMAIHTKVESTHPTEWPRLLAQARETAMPPREWVRAWVAPPCHVACEVEGCSSVRPVLRNTWAILLTMMMLLPAAVGFWKALGGSKMTGAYLLFASSILLTLFKLCKCSPMLQVVRVTDWLHLACCKCKCRLCCRRACQLPPRSNNDVLV